MAEYDDFFQKKPGFMSSYLYDFLVSGSWVSWASSFSLYLVPSDQDKLVTTWLCCCLKKKSFALPFCLLQAEKENKAPRCLSRDSMRSHPCVQWSRSLGLRSRPKVSRTVSLSSSWFLGTAFYIQAVSVSGLKYCRILFLFSFVLKSEVLKSSIHLFLYGVKTPI